MANEKIKEQEQAGNTENTEQDEVFGKPLDSNAFGITGIQSLPKSNDAQEEGKVQDKKEDTKPQEGTEKEKEAAEAQTVKDELLEKLKKESPEFAEICDKKKIGNVKDAFKLYIDQEKEFTRRSAERNNYKKLLEPYFTFDELGNVIGYTELGKKLQEQGEQLPTKEQAQEVAGGDKPQKEGEIDFNQLTPKFWELFEQNPIGAILRIANAVTQFNINGEKGNFKKAIDDLNTQLKPILEERENQRILSLIDEVAKEQMQQGDTKAQDFIDEYADEIEAELKKIAPDFRKANPKLAIEQAYLKVKSAKIKDWQNSMLKKQEEERGKETSATETGTGQANTVEPSVDPEIAGMKETLKSKPASAFF